MWNYFPYIIVVDDVTSLFFFFVVNAQIVNFAALSLLYAFTHVLSLGCEHVLKKNKNLFI